MLLGLPSVLESLQVLGHGQEHVFFRIITKVHLFHVGQLIAKTSQAADTNHNLDTRGRSVSEVRPSSRLVLADQVSAKLNLTNL